MSFRQRISNMFYFKTMTDIILNPGRFFEKNASETGMLRSFGFLTLSGVIFSAASALLQAPKNPFLAGGVLFANTIGMAAISGLISYLILLVVRSRTVSLAQCMTVFAFSSGAAAAAAWLPHCIWLTEPWKWYLVGTGMSRVGGLSRKQSVIVVLSTIAVLVAVFSQVEVLAGTKSF